MTHIGTHEDSPYIVTELLEGAELRAQLTEGAIALRKAIDYAQQIVSGLAAAHVMKLEAIRFSKRLTHGR